jgi:hypothetical protein
LWTADPLPVADIEHAVRMAAGDWNENVLQFESVLHSAVSAMRS